METPQQQQKATNTNQNIYTKFPLNMEEESLFISPDGMKRLLQIYDPKDPMKNFNWTTDYNLEMPVLIQKNGLGSIPPMSLPELFEECVSKKADKPALSKKENGKWKTLNFKQFFDQCKYFGQALIKLGINKQKAVNIIGFNAPEWSITFYGSIFGFFMPVGVYTTNGIDACRYIAEHSEAEVIVVENRVQLQKYLKVWNQLPQLKYAILYADTIPEDLPSEFKGKVLLWNNVIESGKTYKPTDSSKDINFVMKQPKPGNCCTLVYTSGTTGPPKAVMLSHDNYTWTARQSLLRNGPNPNGQDRIVSYLPLSHVASQMTDVIGCITAGSHIYFSDPSALQGSLVNYLVEVRPTIFFSVPRVWEKIEEKMKLMAQSNGFIKTKIANWAKSLGPEGTYNELYERPTSVQFKLAKAVIFNTIKKKLGLDQARFLLFGAAPLANSIRQYFISLNMFLINGYGMSECSGPETFSDVKNFDQIDDHALKSTGAALEGTQMIIYKPDADGNGEICYKGRNRFLGYFKNEEATRQTIDDYGYLHSGDVGKLDSKGNLAITGRIKELLITAGGENVAPVIIEDIIKEELKFVSNALVVGDNKKFLAVILTLKHELDKEGKLTDNLNPESIPNLQNLGINVKTVTELKNHPKLKSIIDEAIKRSNDKVISKAQSIQKWRIVDGDFTEAAGDLTPTQKLKRSVVTKKYHHVIESFYIEAKL